MGLRPLHVAVRRVQANEKTAGGGIIFDTARKRPAEDILGVI